MEIRCPDCAVRYDVPVELVTAARRTRCVRCGTVWTPAAPVAATTIAPLVSADAVEPAATGGTRSGAPTVVERVETTAAGFDPFAGPSGTATIGARSSGTVLAAAWTASLLVLLALGAVLVAERRHVVAAWPPAGRLYAAIGLRVAQGGGG